MQVKVNNKPVPKEVREKFKEDEKSAKAFQKVYGNLDLKSLLKHIEKLEKRIAKLEEKSPTK